MRGGRPRPFQDSMAGHARPSQEAWQAPPARPKGRVGGGLARPPSSHGHVAGFLSTPPPTPFSQDNVGGLPSPLLQALRPTQRLRDTWGPRSRPSLEHGDPRAPPVSQDVWLGPLSARVPGCVAGPTRPFHLDIKAGLRPAPPARSRERSWGLARPIPGHGLHTRPSRDARQDPAFRPSRQKTNWWDSPPHPGTHDGPRQPVSGHVAGLAHPSQETWRASPACRVTCCEPRPPFPGHMASLARRPGTRGGPYQPFPGHLAGHTHPSVDAGQTPPARPGTS
ncbi:mucin-1-like [Macrobrachium nipponense]|uniref:mucin-1-like n=1 Tax=Macrobrachium nipponense TaxID=159736 RepID=UPI0030C86C97